MAVPFYIDRDPLRKKIRPHYLTLLFEKMGQGLMEDCVPGSRDGMFYPVHLGSPYRLARDLSPGAKSGGIFIYDHLNWDAWRAIEDRGGYLLVDHIVESFFGRRDMVERLHEGLATAGIAPSRLVLLNGNLRSAERYEALTAEMGISQKAHVLPYNGCYWLVNAHNRAVDENITTFARRAADAERMLGRKRGKKFVSFNGKGRPHRTYVVLRMLAEGRDRDGFISLLGHESSDSPTVERIAAQIARFPDSEKLTPFIADFVSRLPLSIDVTREDSREGQALKFVLPWASPDPKIYDDTYFSVVLDTSFTDEGTLFHTPIAYKSFMNFSPFVYFGNFRGLKALREMGFRSFAPFIDESYDLIEDDNQRLSAAYAEFDRLASLSHEQLNAGVESIWESLVHNFRLIHRDDQHAFKLDWDERITCKLP